MLRLAGLILEHVQQRRNHGRPSLRQVLKRCCPRGRAIDAQLTNDLRQPSGIGGIAVGGGQNQLRCLSTFGLHGR